MFLALVASVALASPDAGADVPAEFAPEVKLLWQVMTCQDTPLPENVDAKAVKAYCDKQVPRFQNFKKHWGEKGREFLVSKQPKELPEELVYPFGGGDLMSALMAFPAQKVITTLSLELAGDPRRITTTKDAKTLKTSLLAIAETSASTLMSNDSKSVNLSKIQRSELPGQLSMHLMGLGLFDFEPVSVRFFRVEADGSLHYYSRAEIDALEGTTASKLKETWRAPDFSPAFANVEVQFAPKGQQGPVRIHRHIGANLSDDGLKAAPGVLKYIQNKGRIAVMTKAASYLLWRPDFAVMRDTLVAQAVYMISDSTGVPPRYWKKAGCTVDAYGSFQKSFLGTWEGYQVELRELFAKAKAVPMRFGYPDGSPEKRNHLMVVNCPAKP